MTDLLDFYSLQPASCSVPAGDCGAVKEGLAILQLEKEAKHLGVLTMV